MIVEESWAHGNLGLWWLSLPLLILNVLWLELHHIFNEEEYASIASGGLSLEDTAKEFVFNGGDQVSKLQRQHDEEELAEFLNDLVNFVSIVISLKLQRLSGLVHDVHVAQVVHHVASVYEDFPETLNLSVLEVVTLLLLNYG